MEERQVVNTQVLRDTAEKMKNINENMDAKLTEINKTMNDLETYYKSDSSTEIRTAMNALKPRFEEYKNVIESYARFLLNTAQYYEDTETTLTSNAAAFK